MPLSDTSAPVVPLAHADELHLDDLLIAAPLLVLMVIGLVLFVRAGRSNEAATETAAPEESATGAGSRRGASRTPGARPRRDEEMSARRVRLSRGIAVTLTLASLVALGALVTGGGEEGDGKPEPGTTDPGRSAAAAERFAELRGADSNRCSLAAADVRRMRNGMRLQGACCFPMDEAAYTEQLRELRGYREHAVIPRDPYDISVALAKRLLTYRQIALDRRERAAHASAKRRSALGGPCCCSCWRWQAFKGQARFLLARREWSAGELARLWDHEEGCGGAGEHA